MQAFSTASASNSTPLSSSLFAPSERRLTGSGSSYRNHLYAIGGDHARPNPSDSLKARWPSTTICSTFFEQPAFGQVLELLAFHPGEQLLQPGPSVYFPSVSEAALGLAPADTGMSYTLERSVQMKGRLRYSSR